MPESVSRIKPRSEIMIKTWITLQARAMPCDMPRCPLFVDGGLAR